MVKVELLLVDSKGHKRKRKPIGQRTRKNASLVLLLKGFHGAAAEVRGRGRARDNKRRQDKSTAALSPSEGERPAV